MNKMRKNIYFASDLHLGIPNEAKSLQREKLFIQFLNEIQHDCKTLYLVGDVWDFWFEYNTVVPKGYIRLLGKLAELKDNGIDIHFFIGNHDMWMFRYLTDELQIPIHRRSLSVEHFGKKIFIAHGDGLGPNDKGYKFIKAVFANKICQFLFNWIHPDIGTKIALFWSRKSRQATGNKEDIYRGDDREYLYQYVKRKQEKDYHDLFVFGHRHLPIDVMVDNKARYINLGDWIQYFTYLKIDENEVALLRYA